MSARRIGRLALPLALLWGLASLASAAELELRLVKDAAGKAKAIEVAGLSKDEARALAKLEPESAAWPRLLAVYVASEGRGDIPPILGNYSVSLEAGDATLRFTPKFAFKQGMRYRVILQPAAFGDPLAADFPGDRKVITYLTTPAAPRGEPAHVMAVYPTAKTLPENQLRFYLHFSAPMSRGEAYERIRLLDQRGKPVAFPFLEIGEELWDNSGTRLTLLIDPGRIKRGLRPREEDGPVLEEGKKYTLFVDKRWRDAAGQPLTANFEKPFAVGPPIESALDTATWKIEMPPSGSKQPLVIRFPAPLDRALLERTIGVQFAGEKMVAGQVTIVDEETAWQFVPDEVWATGPHELRIDKTLEDLVGNRIGVPFEVDQTGPIDKQVQVEVHRVPFTIGPGGSR